MTLKLAEVRSLRSLAAAEAEPEPKNVQPDPGNLAQFRGEVGKTYWFRVTGAQAGAGSISGTDVYTLDSQLSVAAVHVGAAKPGETGIVRT